MVLSLIALITGTGWRLAGRRRLSDEEFKNYESKFNLKKAYRFDYIMATYSIQLLFFPLLPIRTIIYNAQKNLDLTTGIMEIVHGDVYSASDSGLWYLGHILNDKRFYVWPAIIILLIVYNLVRGLI